MALAEDCEELSDLIEAQTKLAPPKWRYFVEVAEPTGLEPATSDVTGRRSNQLNYDSAKLFFKYLLRPEI